MTQNKFFEGSTRRFPINPFPDVEPSDFNKLNKKRVTEDFVSENFELIGWRVFEPFTDTGIDRIITKRVCPKGHTPLDSFDKEKCSECGTETIDVTRFLQIKTRALKNGIFGFTLKPKDMRIDPRHVYVLYCDTTQDFFIVPIFDYLGFFEHIKSNPFSATSFRRGNQKLNSLRYHESTDSWLWGEHSWEDFRNVKGLKRLQNPYVDLNLETCAKKTRELCDNLLMKFSVGRTYSSAIEDVVNDALNDKVRRYADKQVIVKQRARGLAYLREKITDKTLFDSIKKYWETMKNLEIMGESEEEDEEKG